MATYVESTYLPLEVSTSSNEFQIDINKYEIVVNIPAMYQETPRTYKQQLTNDAILDARLPRTLRKYNKTYTLVYENETIKYKPEHGTIPFYGSCLQGTFKFEGFHEITDEFDATWEKQYDRERIHSHEMFTCSVDRWFRSGSFTPDADTISIRDVIAMSSVDTKPARAIPLV